VLKRQEKYYVADLGLRNQTIHSEKIDYGACMETIVYNVIAFGFQPLFGYIALNINGISSMS